MSGMPGKIEKVQIWLDMTCWHVVNELERGLKEDGKKWGYSLDGGWGIFEKKAVTQDKR